MSALLHDLRTAARQLRRAPGFSALAIGLLAVGLGATIATTSLFDSIVLRPLPYPQPEELVVLRARNPAKAIDQEGLSVTDLRDFQNRSHAFTHLGGFRPNFASYTPPSGEPAQLITCLVTPGLFDALGAQPLRGRLFADDEFSFSATPTVILSDAAWERYFNRRPDILDATILLDDVPHTVIGIMPATFREPAFVDAWLPFPAESPEYFARDSRYWTGIGRLAPAVSLTVAATEINSLSRDLAREYPDTNRDWTASATSLLEQRVTAVRTGLLLILATVALVLLIVCANLANLLLARSLVRMPELGVRLALGATAGRLARVVMLESLLLALAGGAIGTGLAAIGLHLIPAHIPPVLLPRAPEVALQPLAVALGLAATLGCAIACSALPAWRLARADVNQWLKDGLTRGTTSRGTARWQAVLVAGQVALTMAVLAAALLLMRSLVRLQSVPPGFSPTNVLTIRLSPPHTRYDTNADLARYYEHLIEAVQTVPGVISAAVNASTPLTGITMNYPTWREGTSTDAASALDAVYAPISSDYLRTLQLPLQRGRGFDQHDDAQGAQVALVNETYARRMFPGRDPIGQRVLVLPWMQTGYREIVGIVADVRQSSLADPPPPQLYVPQQQMPWFFSTLLVRVNQPAVAGAVRAKLQATDPTLPATPVLLTAVIDRGTTVQRLQTYLFAGFGLLALGLSAFGLYASLRFTLVRGLREMGIRLALGATPGSIQRLVLRQVAILLGAGLLAGAALSWPVVAALRSQLFGIGPGDPVTFAALALIMVGVGLATGLPLARRAARTDPAHILQAP